MDTQQSDATLLDQEPCTESFLDEVLHGLQQSPKTFPCKYFYHQRGSQRFDQICELDEYYVTRVELEIMEAFAPEMSEHLAPV